MQSQLVAFLTKNNFLSVHQSGFRKKYSPETATVHFVDHILEQMDKQRITGCTFLVLKKAFDLVDDHCLLHKLGNIMELESLKWFEDYLTTRTQKVKYNQNVSSSLGIGYRVPLGSILSPILFVIYINDLPQILLTTSIGMYWRFGYLLPWLQRRNHQAGSAKRSKQCWTMVSKQQARTQSE